MLVALPFAWASAQGKAKDDSTTTWTLEGNHGGYCIWYLADPDLVRKLVPDNVTLAPAGDGAGLHAMVRRFVEDEPRLSQWIPGALCLGFFDSVSTGDRVMVRAKAGKPIVVAFSYLAAKGPLGVGEAGNYLVSLMSDSRQLRDAGDNLGIDLDGIEVASRPHSEGSDPDVAIKVSGALIRWSGHPIGDGDVGMTREVSFGYGGRRKTDWLVRMEVAPGRTHPMVGALAVEENGDLATVLKASPLRAIGPEDDGGTVRLTFTNETHHR